MTYTTEEFVRHSLQRILRSVKYRNTFVCLPCLVAMTLQSLHPGWRPAEITRATAAAFVSAGLISALVFPMAASYLLRTDARVSAAEPA